MIGDIAEFCGNLPGSAARDLGGSARQIIPFPFYPFVPYPAAAGIQQLAAIGFP